MRACTSSNSRAFSIAITAWSAKDFSSATCLSSNRRGSMCPMPMAPTTLPSQIIGRKDRRFEAEPGREGLGRGRRRRVLHHELQGLLGEHGAAADSRVVNGARIGFEQFGNPRPCRGRHFGHPVTQQFHHRKARTEQPHHVAHDGVEHRLGIGHRAADRSQNFPGRGLMLQRLGEVVGALAQLVEQARILDGDDRLRGEVRYQLDLLVGERPDLMAVDAEWRRSAHRP